jgi:isopenicillin N synthase-like dioxygenase
MSSSNCKYSHLAPAIGLALLTSAIGYVLWKNVTGSKDKDSKKESKSAKSVRADIPVIDFDIFFNKDKDPVRYAEECDKVAEAFHTYGIVIVRDPRVSEADNDRFLSQMERYFEQSDGVRDARPQYHYQVGVTGELIEKPRDHAALINSYEGENKPLSAAVPTKDPKWRFFWRIGPQPEKTEFPQMNMDPVIPEGFPQWKDVMDMWGNKMLSALFVLAEMSAVGFHMPKATFTDRMKFGPHLLAPTGSNFNKYDKVGTVLAGFHYDLNFMTIHGKSRFPGLYVWTREGVKTPVVVPDGCLIVQAGKQFEYLTGGYVMAGFHEVVVNERTKKVIDDKRAKGESLWRVSSTLFGHMQSDQVLQPLPPFDTQEAKNKWQPIKTGLMVRSSSSSSSPLL